jgi:hypothetical protein
MMLLPSFADAGLTSVLTAEHRDWDFIQSVGGIMVSDPVQKENGTVWLPIICNVSGLEKITTKPSIINSALVVRKVEYKIEEDKILIYIKTSLIDKQNKNVKTEGIILDNIRPGIYKVEYLNPDDSSHFVREIIIDRQN